LQLVDDLGERQVQYFLLAALVVVCHSALLSRHCEQVLSGLGFVGRLGHHQENIAVTVLVAGAADQQGSVTAGFLRRRIISAHNRGRRGASAQKGKNR
jgi:hypothetical protein